MRITQVSVEGLFGIFNHVIRLNTEERITIIHGPNGFGKTTVLKMLNGLFNSRYSVFNNTPFNRFSVNLDNGTLLEIIRKHDKAGKSNDKISLFLNLYEMESGKKAPSLKERRDLQDVYKYIIESLDLLPGLDRIAPMRWIYHPTGETFNSVEAVIERFGDNLPFQLQDKHEPKWLKDIKRNINVRFIESQRLLNVNFIPSRYSRNGSIAPMLPTVSAYSEELAETIQYTLAEYGAISQALDRTFPMRVIQQDNSLDLSNQQLLERLKELEERRNRLIEVGLLDKGDDSSFELYHQNVDEKTKNILSVYVDDVEEKLSVFDKIANKIELLRDIINKKIAYSYKRMDFSKEKGFIFKTLHESSLAAGTLSPTDLSSGEQHELVLLYELLFKVKSNSLVLIDEPELSLHVSWQNQFLEDLQEITKLADLDILMATHSPDLIQDRWDLTVELKGTAEVR
jgi:predicted ATP-binding protein involved in virulence